MNELRDAVVLVFLCVPIAFCSFLIVAFIIGEHQTRKDIRRRVELDKQELKK